MIVSIRQMLQNPLDPTAHDDPGQDPSAGPERTDALARTPAFPDIPVLSDEFPAEVRGMP